MTSYEKTRKRIKEFVDKNEKYLKQLVRKRLYKEKLILDVYKDDYFYRIRGWLADDYEEMLINMDKEVVKDLWKIFEKSLIKKWGWRKIYDANRHFSMWKWDIFMTERSIKTIKSLPTVSDKDKNKLFRKYIFIKDNKLQMTNIYILRKINKLKNEESMKKFIENCLKLDKDEVIKIYDIKIPRRVKLMLKNNNWE